jgi:hypothetical protein
VLKKSPIILPRYPEPVKFPFYPHKENVSNPVNMLIKHNDITVVAIKEIGDVGNDALAVGAMHKQYR